MRRLLRRLRAGEGGFSLIEMLMVMVLMGIVMGSITTVFITGSNAQTELNRFFQAQQQARAGLDKLRADVHCASGAQATTVNSVQALKLNDTNCYASTPTITWCLIPSTALTGRYALYRSTIDNTSTCTANDTGKIFVADYLMPVGGTPSVANILTTPNIVFQSLETVGIDLKVSTNPTTSAQDTYELTDSLVTRDYARCLATSATYVAGSPGYCTVGTVS
ncbi:MAG: type II secretion system protein [Actinobacteria bacterium]|nr:type II secretion system protein [Actinomycetota bacterium]MBV8479523.1 type II secretion system protein [Actinomycetota bacterium]MBV8597961.1 type II secretion system protein [Actinomycetota bacterium]